MIMRVWAKLTGGRLVWLKDHDGEVTLSIARVTVFGDIVAKRYWPFKIRQCVLMPDGSVRGGAYVHFWKYADHG